MAEINRHKRYKTIKFISGGSLVSGENDTDTNPKIYTGTENKLSQTSFTFDDGGKILYRKRTRPAVNDDWGNWGSWVTIAGEENLKEVWTNPNPTSAMGISTLNLTFTKEPKFLIIVARIHASSSYLTTMTIPYVDGKYVFQAVRYDGSSGNYLFGRYFNLTTSNKTIATDGGYSMNTYGNFNTSNTSAVVPLNIYGIGY